MSIKPVAGSLVTKFSKLNDTKKGAIIGAGVGAGIQTVQFARGGAKVAASVGLGKGAYAACAAAGIALYSLIGAGIGKLIQRNR